MTYDTLIVVADGGGARAFLEKVRHGPLTELAAWAVSAPESERHPDHGHGGTTASHFGKARHNVHDSDPRDAAERKFLIQVAERIGQAAARRQFDKLVLIASPKALGILRATIDPAAARCIEHTEPHDRLDESAEQLRQRLRSLRAPA